MKQEIQTVLTLSEEMSHLLQIDLRDDPKTMSKLNDLKEKPISPEQGHKLAKEVRLIQSESWVQSISWNSSHRNTRKKNIYSQILEWRPGGHSWSMWTSSRVQRGTERPHLVCRGSLLSDWDQKENKMF